MVFKRIKVRSTMISTLQSKKKTKELWDSGKSKEEPLLGYTVCVRLEGQKLFQLLPMRSKSIFPVECFCVL